MVDREKGLGSRMVEMAQGVGLVLRLALDPTTDPIYVEFMRMREQEKAGLIESQSFANRLKSAFKKGEI